MECKCILISKLDKESTPPPPPLISVTLEYLIILVISKAFSFLVLSIYPVKCQSTPAGGVQLVFKSYLVMQFVDWMKQWLSCFCFYRSSHTFTLLFIFAWYDPGCLNMFIFFFPKLTKRAITHHYTKLSGCICSCDIINIVIGFSFDFSFFFFLLLASKAHTSTHSPEGHFYEFATPW